MRLVILTCALVLVGAASTSAVSATKGKPLDDAQCKAAWTIVSPHGEAISKGQPVPSIIDSRGIDYQRSSLFLGQRSSECAIRASSMCSCVCGDLLGESCVVR